ncbi:hypothetical protein BX600DRAFT_466973 [Xylariales sp. PMI_506]|nr:hypothetical protein BX600DRAFT_466973 [Xylariales sp. PMI_506]
MKKGGRGSHVKTGCRTCKLRRLKCDEARPACHKCTHAGKVCDGYGIWGGGSVRDHTYADTTGHWRISSLRQYRAAALLGDKSMEEKEMFEFFCKCPSLKISGVFKSEFWDRILIQASLADSGVFHAAVAIGAVYHAHLMSMERQGWQPITTNQLFAQMHSRLVLQQYNKAIEQLRQILVKEDSHSLRAAAITSLLFVCLEMMRGQHRSMKSHYQYATILLKKLWVYQKPSGDDHLLKAFKGLSMHLGLLDHYSPGLENFTEGINNVLNANISKEFNDIKSARESLESLIASIVELSVEAHSDELRDTQVPSNLIQRHAALMCGMNSWKDAYRLFMKEASEQFSLYEILSLRILQAYHTMASIILGTCLSYYRQVSFDAFTLSFVSILEQVEEILRLSGCFDQNASQRKGCEHAGSFTIEMGAFTPIYYVALKCRDPGLRRRATALLDITTHSEGIWTGSILSRIANKVMVLEEASSSAAREVDADSTGSGRKDSENADGALRTEAYVPEQSRYHCVSADLSLGSASRTARLKCTRFIHNESGNRTRWETSYHEVSLD